MLLSWIILMSFQNYLIFFWNFFFFLIKIRSFLQVVNRFPKTYSEKSPKIPWGKTPLYCKFSLIWMNFQKFSLFFYGIFESPFKFSFVPKNPGKICWKVPLNPIRGNTAVLHFSQVLMNFQKYFFYFFFCIFKGETSPYS